MNDKLDRLVSNASDAVSGTEGPIEAQDRAGSHGRRRLVILSLLVVLLLVLDIVLGMRRREAELAQLRQGVIEVLQQADADVRGVYARTGSLPDSLDDPLLEPVVTYRKLDAETFELKMIEAGLAPPVTIDINTPVDAGELAAALQRTE